MPSLFIKYTFVFELKCELILIYKNKYLNSRLKTKRKEIGNENDCELIELNNMNVQQKVRRNEMVKSESAMTSSEYNNQ